MEVCQNFTDRSCTFKGKRTKRSRPSSPLDIVGTTTTVTTTSSSTAGGSDDGGRGGGGGGGDFYNSPTTSTTQISTTSTSEEDEDMANCLILLAQSGCGQKVQEVVTELKKEKISSKKFAEMTTSTTGKAGFYVYECKTCNKTFPSFQALGGHRASHKKPKTILEEKKSVTVTTTSDTAAVYDHQQQHQENDQEQGRLNKISISHSTQIVVNNNTKPKIHECSICGSEFSSGQALGGHMRRHRPPTTTTMTTTTTAATTNTKISTNIETTTSCNNVVSESSSSHHDEKSTRNILSLDLNLPAPSEEEDDHKFEQSLVFSAVPLVDCYY